MDRTNIVSTINNFLVEEFEIEKNQITPDAHLRDDLGLESLDYVDIAVIVQKEFGLTLKGEEMTGILTLKDLYDHIDNLVNKN